MKIPKREWLQILILAAPFCAAALLWDKLPGRMPIHWGIDGQVDGFAPRLFAALFLPCLNVGLALLVMVLPRLDPKVAQYDDETKASLRHTFATMRLAITLFLAVLAVAMLAAPVYPVVSPPAIIATGAGALFAVMGNLLTKLRPNWFFGIRTPWTLESREVWAKTHRLGGKLMFGSGCGLLILSLLLPMKLFILCAVLPVIVVVALVPTIYSYRLCVRLRSQ